MEDATKQSNQDFKMREIVKTSFSDLFLFPFHVYFEIFILHISDFGYFGSFEKMTSALPPPPRQSLSLADSSSQTCPSDVSNFCLSTDSLANVILQCLQCLQCLQF